MMSYDDRSISSGAFAKASMHRRSARALLQQSAVSRGRGQGGGENAHAKVTCYEKGQVQVQSCAPGRGHKKAIFVLLGFVLPGSQFER